MSTTELPSNVDVVFSPAAVNDQIIENLSTPLLLKSLWLKTIVSSNSSRMMDISFSTMNLKESFLLISTARKMASTEKILIHF